VTLRHLEGQRQWPPLKPDRFDGQGNWYAQRSIGPERPGGPFAGRRFLVIAARLIGPVAVLSLPRLTLPSLPLGILRPWRRGLRRRLARIAVVDLYIPPKPAGTEARAHRQDAEDDDE
jgi:hypothetical protein